MSYPHDYEQLLESLRAGLAVGANLGAGGFGASIAVVRDQLEDTRSVAEGSIGWDSKMMIAIFGCAGAAISIRLAGRSSSRPSVEALVDEVAREIVSAAAGLVEVELSDEIEWLDVLQDEWDEAEPERFREGADEHFIRLAGAIAEARFTRKQL